jgi:hypothetical protein
MSTAEEAQQLSIPSAMSTAETQPPNSTSLLNSVMKIPQLKEMSYPDPGLVSYTEFRHQCHIDSCLKARALTSRFEKPLGWIKPKRKFGSKNRSCPDVYLDSSQALSQFIHYSPSKDGLYCIACLLFSDQQTALTKNAFTDWKNHSAVIESHTSSQEHMSSTTKGLAFLKACNQSQPRPLRLLSEYHLQKLNQNTKVAQAIVKTLILLGKQGLAIRGKTDETSNFKAVLDHIASYEPDVANHLANAPRNARYTSHRTQNDFIDLIKKQIQSSILQDVRNGKFYTILADESADVSGTEQVSLLLRYLKKFNGVFEVQEDFMSFIPTHSTTGATIASLIDVELKRWSLLPNNAIAQGYDGGSNMKGHINGVQAILLRTYPHAVYMHCLSHNLNLVIMHSAAVPYIRNMYGVLNELLYFITASPKRQGIYLEKSDSRVKLQKFCPTR